MRYVRVPLNLAWLYAPYLAKPVFWPEIGRRLWHVRKRTDKSDMPAALAWCAERAIGEDQLFEALGVTPIDPEERFADLFEQATLRVQAVPLQLGGAGHLRLLYSLCEQFKAWTVIETGVAYGWSSLAILLSLAPRGGRLFSVDLPYFKLRNDPWVGIAVPAALHAHWRLLRMADREGLPRAIRAADQVDLVHYDSDKSANGRAFAYPLLWRSLRPGGLFLSDDVGDNFAFRDFAAGQGIDPIVVTWREKYIGVMVKPARTSPP